MHDERWLALEAHRERLLRVARRRCPTYEDAEDVVQEALLRCATFRDLDETRIGPFLTSVTVRLCADVHRHTERTERTARAAGRAGPVRPIVVDPADEACRDADVRMLTDLLGRLPGRQRDVLVDRAAGLSVDQIGSRHALTYKAAESALSRARATMRMALRSALAVVPALPGVRRRRTAMLAAAPAVVALVLVSPATRPFAPPVERLPAVPDEGLAVQEHRALLDSRERTLVRRPAAAPAARPQAATEVEVRVDDGDTILYIREDLFGYWIGITDKREDEAAVDTARRCADEGVWVQVSPRDGVGQGCGERREPHDGSIDVYVGDEKR